MKKYLLLSLVVSTLIVPVLSAKSMYKQFTKLQSDVNFLVEEVNALKESNIALEKELISEQKQRKKLLERLNTFNENTPHQEFEGSKLEDIEDDILNLNKKVNGNNLKFSADFRTSVDSIYYKMADGRQEKNSALFSNRLWLMSHWRANQHITFSSELAYNKVYGARTGLQNSTLEGYDWIASENSYSSEIRLKSAYFLYINDTFLGLDLPWTMSIGRRPSTNGKLINLRDDMKAASPLGHAINVEFDGLSTKFNLAESSGVDGMYVRLCAGRGVSNAQGRFSSTPYATNSGDVDNNDLVGFIFTPFNNGQYSMQSQLFTARNLIDLADGQDPTKGFKTVGNLNSATMSFTIDGIGDGWSDFTDFMFFFLSASASQTDPQKSQKMLGSEKSELGYSIWSGLQFDSLISDAGRWGIEYNYGSQYWRSITYGEDTIVGSKLAVRGSAYEAYFTEPLVDESFSLQLRLTYLDYAYSGSNGFFGDTTGTPYSMQEAQDLGSASFIVDSATDVRFYLRYKF